MTERMKSGIAEIARGSALSPQESPAKVKSGQKSLFISIPNETSLQENRIALKPESVDVLTKHGHDILVESGAGDSASFSDQEYSEAGARIISDRKEVFQGDIIVKVEPPTDEELDMMKPGATLISAYQPGTQTIDYLHSLNKKRITALGYEFIEDKVGGLPLVRAMSEIAGSSVMLIAAEYLSRTNDGQGVILGGVTGVPPTKVVIVGAGTVAEYAARSALGLGADIQIFDNHIYKLRRLKHAIGYQVHTATIDHNSLSKAVASADVLIGAIRPEKGLKSMIITEDMIMGMKPGSVVIDVTVDQGGCIETTHPTSPGQPVFTTHEVIHYCVPNIPSRVSKTASIAISNIFTPIILQIAEAGGVDEMIFSHRWFMRGVYTYRGSLTNLYLARQHNLGYKDLSLLMAARF